MYNKDWTYHMYVKKATTLSYGAIKSLQAEDCAVLKKECFQFAALLSKDKNRTVSLQKKSLERDE